MLRELILLIDSIEFCSFCSNVITLVQRLFHLRTGILIDADHFSDSTLDDEDISANVTVAYQLYFEDIVHVLECYQDQRHLDYRIVGLIVSRQRLPYIQLLRYETVT